MFRTLTYPSSGACDYSVELYHWLYVLGSMCVGVSLWLGWGGTPKLKPETRVPPHPNHTETPTHIEPRTFNQWYNSTE